MVGSMSVPEIVDAVCAAQHARRRALLIPREHGAWGLLLIPLFTGLAAGLATAHHGWQVVLFAAAVLSLFWLRTPCESLIGASAVKARSADERWLALTASATIAAIAAACLIALMWGGRNLHLFLFGAVAGCSFVGQALLKNLGRRTRMLSQLVGTIGLSSTAPAAYYVATGHLDERAIVLWAANWIFAGNQIHFVQMRIHAARAAGFAEKFAQGRLFFFAQLLFLIAMVVASVWRLLSPMVVLAFLPVILRGTLWFFRQAETLDVRRLGWSEMKYGIAFGSLLAIAFLMS
jgi:YwiC-like protein